jgi:hypothetical protein
MVFDGLGRMVHRDNQLGPETSIDMGHLANGLYTLRAMRADGSLSTIRIVLQQ